MNKVWKREEDWYVTRCACESNDHIIDMVKDNGCINLTFKCSCYTEGFLDRIKTAWSILITGHINEDQEFIFEGKKHVNDFIEALNELNK